MLVVVHSRVTQISSGITTVATPGLLGFGVDVTQIASEQSVDFPGRTRGMSTNGSGTSELLQMTMNARRARKI